MDERFNSLPARMNAAESAAACGGGGEIVSASLAKADRDLVRTEGMRIRVVIEARRRAPRRLLGQNAARHRHSKLRCGRFHGAWSTDAQESWYAQAPGDQANSGEVNGLSP